MKKVGKITEITPCGSQILIELLTAQEILGTNLHVNEKQLEEARGEGYQAYVLAVGPSVKCDDWGFQVGDRVLFSARSVLCPNFDKNKRERFLIDPQSIRAVLQEKPDSGLIID